MIKIVLNIIFFSLVSSFVHSSEEKDNQVISMKLISQNCNGCHGWNAKGIENRYSITKLNYEEFIKRMNYYKKENTNSIMKRILTVFTDEDIIKLADFYYKNEDSE